MQPILLSLFDHFFVCIRYRPVSPSQCSPADDFSLRPLLVYDVTTLRMRLLDPAALPWHRQPPSWPHYFPRGGKSAAKSIFSRQVRFRSSRSFRMTRIETARRPVTAKKFSVKTNVDIGGLHKWRQAFSTDFRAPSLSSRLRHKRRHKSHSDVTNRPTPSDTTSPIGAGRHLWRAQVRKQSRRHGVKFENFVLDKISNCFWWTDHVMWFSRICAMVAERLFI
jgi:hypothetical protein